MAICVPVSDWLFLLCIIIGWYHRLRLLRLFTVEFVLCVPQQAIDVEMPDSPAQQGDCKTHPEKANVQGEGPRD